MFIFVKMFGLFPILKHSYLDENIYDFLRKYQPLWVSFFTKYMYLLSLSKILILKKENTNE